jgi:hypothetical protein
MSLANAMKTHGMKLDRWMDPNGRIVHGSPSLSSAMPIETHTFHGGEETVDAGAVVTPWWQMPGVMDAERDQMKRWCPGFTEIEGGDTDAPIWYGSITTRVTTFQVAIAHRADHGLPRVIVDDRHVSPHVSSSSPHRYLSGALCVAAQEDWDASVHTAATVVGWTAHWFDCYVHWLFSTPHRWPIETHVQAA